MKTPQSLSSSQNLPTVTRIALAASVAAAGLVLQPALAPAPFLEGSSLAFAQETSATKQVTVSQVLNDDGTVTITGSGWTSTATDRGAVVAFKWDGGAVFNHELPAHPLTGQPLTDARFANVNFYTVAEPDGTFSVKVKLPDSTTAQVQDADWQAGSSHTLQALAGSLAEGDSAGSVAASFTVPTTSAEDTSTWPSVTAGSAQVLISSVTTGENATIRLIGQGWTKEDDTSASTVSIKLEYLDAEGNVRQYKRTDGAISAYLQSVGRAADPTSWGLLIPNAERAQANQGLLAIQEDGSFDIELELPEEVQKGSAGDYLAVFIQSGRNADADVTRSVRSEPIPVNGVAGSLPTDDDYQTVCTTDLASPTFEIVTPTVELGGKLRVVGEGWCNTENQRATTVAVKIDEGGISRLDSSLHSNRTIWAILYPDPATGRIDATIDLPDGTTASSSPALAEGSHSLRVLSGSLAAGDRAVTLGGAGKLDFVIGQYSPNAIPDTLSNEDLSSASQRQMTAQLSGRNMSVTVPGAEAGQWVMINPYIGGSVRSNWGSGWVQLDAQKSVSYLLPEDLAAGEYQIAAQSGEQENFGALLGWAPLTVAETQQEVVPSAVTPLNQSQVSRGTGSPAAFTVSSLASQGLVYSAVASSAGTTVASSTPVSQLTSIPSQVLRAPARSQSASSTATSAASEPGSSSPAAGGTSDQQGTNDSALAQEGNQATTETSSVLDPNNLLLCAAAVVVLGALAFTRQKKKS